MSNEIDDIEVLEEELGNDSLRRRSEGQDVSELSEMSEVSEVGEPIVKRTGRGKGKEYEEIKNFENYESAEKALCDVFEGQYWSKSSRHDADEGYKQYYTCEKNKKCPKKLFILRHSDSYKASIWMSTEPHQHKDIVKGRLPVKITEFIKELIKNGCINNDMIIRRVKENGLPQLTRSQIEDEDDLPVRKANAKKRKATDIEKEQSDDDFDLFDDNKVQNEFKKLKSTPATAKIQLEATTSAKIKSKKQKPPTTIMRPTTRSTKKP